jgi:hypothetical protein
MLYINIRKIFKYYKKILKLKTKLKIYNKYINTFAFVIPKNYIICGKNEIKRMEKHLIKYGYIHVHPNFNSNNLEEIICYQLLHEIGHALDYKLNKNRFLKNLKSYNITDIKAYNKNKIEIIANKFANKEIKNFYYDK